MDAATNTQLGTLIHDSGPGQALRADDLLRIDAGHVADRITDFILSKVEAFHREGAILGMSGGIDSAVVASLATCALGAGRVKALLLPERDSSPESKADALMEITRLGLSHREVVITPLLESLGVYDLVPLRLLGVRSLKAAVVQYQHHAQARALGEMPFRAGLLGTRNLQARKELIDAGNGYARVKHRMRMVTMYYHADLENLLVLGTTNRSEAMSGFVVKWGDNVADVEPILPLYKTQVRQLARYLGVSQRIIDKAPSPDLIPGIIDTLALGIEYELLDVILWGLDQGWPDERITAAMGVTTAQVQHVREMRHRSEHLRSLPPVPDLG